MVNEKIVELILSKHPNLDRNLITARMEEIRHRTEGLIAEETLLRLIAAEYGVELPATPANTIGVSSIHLVPGLNDVTIVGRVIAINPPKCFGGKRQGKVASVLVCDEYGLVRVVLWDSKAERLGSYKLKFGQAVRFSHGYTREGGEGITELHIGDQSEVEVLPENLNIDSFASIEKLATKISALPTVKTKNVTVVGNLKLFSSTADFTAENQKSGIPLRFVVEDETGAVPVTASAAKTAELHGVMKENTSVALVNAKVRSSRSGALELYLDATSYVSFPCREETEIANIKETMKNISVKGEICDKPETREITLSTGEKVKLTVFTLRDKTSSIRISAWRNHADVASQLEPGMRVFLKHVYAKKLGESLTLSTTARTEISFLD
jgi:ssDNA-binding replication factor A large subunit